MTPSLPWLTPLKPYELETVRGTSLGKVVRDEMLRLILSGELACGQRINEPAVASRLQVSRVPVREALRELESSGLVISRKNAGVFVKELNPKEIRDLYQLRGLLDGFAGRCIANLDGATKQLVLTELDACVARMHEAMGKQTTQIYYAENLQFHWLLIQAVDNEQLTQTYRGVVQKLHLSRLKNLSTDFGMAKSFAQHVEIVKSLRVADAAACETLMAHHVGDAFDRLITKTTQETTL